MRPHCVAIFLVRLSPVLLLPGLGWLFAPEFLPMLLIPLVMLAPALLFRGDDGGPGGSGPDNGGGGGSGPRGPDAPSRPPLGGPLLPDAEQSRTRRRDHVVPRRVAPGRRAARDPVHRPARAPAKS